MSYFQHYTSFDFRKSCLNLLRCTVPIKMDCSDLFKVIYNINHKGNGSCATISLSAGWMSPSIQLSMSSHMKEEVVSLACGKIVLILKIGLRRLNSVLLTIRASAFVTLLLG